MVAKLRACEQAIGAGVGDVLIVDGRDEAALDAATAGAVPANATRIVPTMAPADRDDEGDGDRGHRGNNVGRRNSRARSAAHSADLQACADHVRSWPGRAALRRRGARIPRFAVGHRRRVAWPCASRAGEGDCRAGADADPHVEPVLSPVSGTAGGAARPAVGAAAGVFLQQRHRGGRSVPQVRASLLAHPRRTARGIHRARKFVPRPDVRGPVGDLERALSRAVRAARPGCPIRPGQRLEGAARGGVVSRLPPSSPSRCRAKVGSGR